MKRKMIVVLENLEILTKEERESKGFGAPWAQEVSSLEEAKRLVEDMEAEDKEYGLYRPGFYKIAVMDR